jgi:hypothetical protein
MGATTTTLTAMINTLYQPGMPKTFYEGTPFLQLVGFPGKPHLAGDSIDWQMQYAGNAGVIVNEGDALPATGNMTYANMTVAHVTFANTCQVTAQAKAAAKAGYFDGVKMELDGCMSGLLHKIEEKFVSLIEAAINDDTSYGGQTRSTVHADSDVTAGGSAANTLANMSEMYETLQLDPRAVQYNPSDHIITSSPEQLTAYTEIGGALTYGADDETTGANRPYVTNQTDADFDAGLLKHTPKYNKIPWVTLATHTNTLVFLWKRSDVMIEEGQGVQVEPLAKSDLSDSYVMSWIGGLAYRDCYRAARIEALTT